LTNGCIQKERARKSLLKKKERRNNMGKRKFLISMSLVWVLAVFFCGVGQPAAQVLQTGPNGYLIPNYFSPTVPNWANSPPTMRKFVDTMPGLNAAGVNNLGQYIPVAVPDTTTYPGSDYYEIELGEYTKQMHSDLGPTKLRGYRQTNTTDAAVSQFQYLGPLIVATKDRPVRIKFTNSLPTGAGGNLFIPVDKTVEGSGPGPDTPEILRIGTSDDVICATNPEYCFSENRATLHLHGGRTPWISDGTPHQWITPAGEITAYPEGVSKENVPDMPDPGPGAQTFYYTNQQSARLLFYHDHAWGITRLNVYVGEAAGYLITDTMEAALMASGGPLAGLGTGIPLIIQDKTFVDAATIMTTDPTWAWGTNPGKPVTATPVTGDLWWPHVYVPAQNPYNPDFTGVNPMGRWVYAPWFFPPPPICGSSPTAVYPFCIDYGPTANPYNGADSPSPYMPATPNPSWGAEAFLDTPMVNGTAYPSLNVPAGPVRFRILNAAHDRFFNLQLYQAVSKTGYTNPTVAPYDFTGTGPTDLTEVAMVPAVINPLFPPLWPTDGREGGVPDPATRGPALIQIGTEGGFLPAPVLLPNQPVNWVTDPTLFTAGLVAQQNEGGGTLMLGPAERADVIVDFSKFASKTLILYNDAPAPWPALDPHYDYYTGMPDLTEMGSVAGVQPGFGPNTRTIMQIRVGAGSDSTAPVDDYNPTTLANLQTAFTGPTGVFASSQDAIIVGQSDYNSIYGTTFPALAPNWGISTIFDTSLSFQTVDPGGTPGGIQTIPMQPKAVQDEQSETFDKYGRLSAKLGIERGNAAGAAGFVLQNYVEAATEIVNEGEIQVWKITHNGVDTHPVHFHLFDVQVINRVGWDGFIYLPDPNELGWKDTVRVSPLEDTIVALRPITPTMPFGLPDSVRPLNPSQPIGASEGFTNLDPLTGQRFIPAVTNQLVNFGWEYVWHCHILSHEEMDMMRPVVFNAARALPAAPVLSVDPLITPPFVLTWTDATPAATSLGNPANEIGFWIERAVGGGAFAVLATALANATSYTDNAAPGSLYSYRVVAYNAAGDSPSNIVTVGQAVAPAAPSGLAATATGPTQVNLTWTDNSADETGFQVERAIGAGAFGVIATVGANVTAYSDTTVVGGTTYSYRVLATGAGGNSAYSNTATVTTPSVMAPTNLTARLNSGPTRITLTWTDASNNENLFRVWRSVNGGAFAQIATINRFGSQITGTGGTVTYNNFNTGAAPLAAGNTYSYYVTAVSNTVGSSAPSNTASVSFTAPAAPTNLAGSAVRITGNNFQDRVTLTWTDNANNETGFQIQRAQGTGGFFTVATVGANVTTFSQNVSRSFDYRYRVRATNGIGSSAWSNELLVTTP